MKVKNEYVQIKIGNKTYTKKNMILNIINLIVVVIVNLIFSKNTNNYNINNDILCIFGGIGMKRLLSLILALLLLHTFSFCVTADTRPSNSSLDDGLLAQDMAIEETVDYQEYISKLPDKSAGKDNLALGVGDAV